MTTASSTRVTPRRTARLGLAGVALLAAVTGASADDGGLGGFLASIFGGQPQQAAPTPQPRSGEVARHTVRHTWISSGDRHVPSRPLTVRLRQARPRLVFAQAPAKPGKVSIYEDRTLRRGDAVMTAKGVRIFVGSASWPYTAMDFVGLKDAKNVERGASKLLAQLDRLPRG